MERMHVFTYGTLMFPEVWQSVVGRRIRQMPATVHGFQRRAVKGVDFPCLIRSDEDSEEDCQVSGILYFNVSPECLETLDEFEADQYDREVITCELNDGERVEAFAYLWADRYADMIGGEWDVEAFKKEGMRRFLARHGDWR